jgi:hypothetical protein
MNKSHPDSPLWGKNCVLVTPEELAEKFSTKESNQEQLYEIKAQETLHRNPVFLEFLINQASPNTKWVRKRGNNYRYLNV